MKAAFAAYTKKALQTALRAAEFLNDAQVSVYTLPKFLNGNEPFPVRAIPSGDRSFFRTLFQESDLLVFVSALGIAVRMIAPFVNNKKEDPAVLFIDERGRFVISVLSGHIGGANDAAEKLAKAMGAQPVITTATDINHRFSADAWAARQGLIIDDMPAAKAVSAAILERDIPLISDLPLCGDWPEGLLDPGMQTGVPVTGYPVGICISWEEKTPYPVTLRLIPKVIRLGIGCRKGIAPEQIEKAVCEVFSKHRMDLRAVQGVFSIDLKKEEQGLLQFCRSHHWDLTVYTKEELLEVPGDFSSSGFVQSITGVDNVCERAAMKEADRLVIRKTALDGVTVAAAIRETALGFDETEMESERWEKL